MILGAPTTAGALIATVVAALALPAVHAQTPGAGAGGRPNIVLIVADDMGYECVRANGGESYKTPAIDRLASEGMRFRHCYSQPACTPSRVKLMTGRYNSRNYVGFGMLHSGSLTFGNHLRAAGYATCIVGKWQLSGGFDGPGRFGFDEYILWQLTRRPSRYRNPGLEIGGREVDYHGETYGPDVVVDHAIDFITRHKDGPFFLYYPMILPHWPFEPTPDSGDWDPESTGVTSGHGDPKYFAEMVAYTDKMVGRIVSHLDALGIRENTLVLFTSDNGTYTGITSRFEGRDLRGGKGTTSNAGTHVPLIASWPGAVPAGRVNDDLVDFSDFLPTLAELARVRLPDTPVLDGRSFAPQLLGRPGTPREWVYCWYYPNGRVGEPDGGEFARTRRYKLYTDGRFYDLLVDELEETPLVQDDLPPDARIARQTLRAVLDRYKRKR